MKVKQNLEATFVIAIAVLVPVFAILIGLALAAAIV